jgi:hypothetical protein
MKITRVACCLFVLLLSLVAFAFTTTAPKAHAASGNTFVVKFHGLSAFANFDSLVSPGSCVHNEVHVDAFQNTVQKQTTSGANVFIGQMNWCTNAQILFASGSIYNPDFLIDKELLSASLNTTIYVFDNVSGNTFPVSVNLAWTSNSAIGHENQTFYYHTRGFTENSHVNADFRDANVSGTVTDGTTNFTPSPPFLAQIMSAKNFDVTITHP